MRALLCVLLLGCYTGTTTPGVHRCVTFWIPFGYAQSCEDGPPWKPVEVPAPAPADPWHPEPQPTLGASHWCSEMGGCAKDRATCVAAEEAAGRSGMGCHEMREVTK